MWHGHIHLVSLKGSFVKRDLSNESGVGGTADGHPDWSPNGQKIIFDSSRAGGHKI
jgi:Tol biopolymer transport system component